MRVGRPRQKDLDGKIREATMALIREGGISAMSLDQVADRIGISTPTIYRRYASKAELVIASVIEACRPSGPDATGDSLRDVVGLLEYFRLHFEANIQLPALGSLLQESRTNPDLIDAFRSAAIHVYRRHMRQAMVAAQRDGLVQPAAEAPIVVEMLIGAYYARAISGEPFGEHWARDLLAGSGLLTVGGRRRLACNRSEWDHSVRGSPARVVG